MLDIYKCGKCGKIVMVVGNGDGKLVCCDVPMILQEENTVDASTEKHVPVIESTAQGILVKVGSVPHPMEEAHHIQWIEAISGPWLHVKGLKPGDKPEAAFPGLPKDVKTRAYCNLHGLWSNKPRRK